MINQVTLVGRLTKDPDLRKTADGIPVTQITLAVNRHYKNQDGQIEADFVQCTLWRKTAENTARFCRKGSVVGITGRIQSRHYDNNEGRRVYVTEVVAESVQFLGKKVSANAPVPIPTPTQRHATANSSNGTEEKAATNVVQAASGDQAASAGQQAGVGTRVAAGSAGQAAAGERVVAGDVGGQAESRARVVASSAGQQTASAGQVAAGTQVAAGKGGLVVAETRDIAGTQDVTESQVSSSPHAQVALAAQSAVTTSSYHEPLDKVTQDPQQDMVSAAIQTTESTPTSSELEKTAFLTEAMSANQSSNISAHDSADLPF